MIQRNQVGKKRRKDDVLDAKKGRNWVTPKNRTYQFDYERVGNKYFYIIIYKGSRMKIPESDFNRTDIDSLLDSMDDGLNIKEGRMKLADVAKKNLKENKPGTRSSYRQEIDWIMHEVDFVPDDIETYKKWPEPWKTKALKALKYRKRHFNQMGKDKLKTYESKKQIKETINAKDFLKRFYQTYPHITSHLSDKEIQKWLDSAHIKNLSIKKQMDLFSDWMSSSGDADVVESKQFSLAQTAKKILKENDNLLRDNV